MNRLTRCSLVTSVVLMLACVFVARGQTLDLIDRFDRSLLESGVTLVDWEGYIANPAVELTVVPSDDTHPHRFPMRVELRADGRDLMFNLSSTVSLQGPAKTMFIESPGEHATFLMTVFADRDADAESYKLTVTTIDALENEKTITVPVDVVDQDRPGRVLDFPITLNYEYDETGFFDDPRHKRLARQAANDLAYFIADPGYDEVGRAEETSWMWETTGFVTGREITNDEPFRGFLAYIHGISHEESRSGAGASDRAGSGFQHIHGEPTGLRRSGTVSIETTGNWNRLGWFIANDDDTDWLKSGNRREDRHDFYSVVRHELSHALAFHMVHPGFAACVEDGRFVDDDVRAYLGSVDPELNETEHFTETIDPSSGFGVFGNEYGSTFPKKRWMLTKFDLLVAKATGYELRETTAFQPLAAEATDDGIVISGGVPPYFVELIHGQLPDGWSLDSWTGQLTATEDAASPDLRGLAFSVSDQDRATGPVMVMTPTAITEVLVLGMIHGGHRESETFGIETINEIVRRVSPDYILAEIPPDRLDAALESYRQTGEVAEPRVARFPEYTDAIIPLMAEMNFEIIPCAAWTQTMADERSAKLTEWKTTRADAWNEMNEGQSWADDMITQEGLDAHPSGIHSDRYDEIVKQGMEPYDRHFNDDLGLGGWTNINAAHYALIEASLNEHAGEGKRFLVTFGAWHKYWFLEQLRQRDDVELLSLDSFIDE